MESDGGDDEHRRKHVSSDGQDDQGERIDDSELRGASARPSAGPRGNAPSPDPDDVETEGALEGSIGSGDEDKENQIAQIVQAVFQAQQSESYSGLLPHPKHWDKFDSETRERILRMSEAYTTDESQRRDRMVDAEIGEAPRGRRNAMTIMYISLVFAAGSVFIVENTVAAGIFLAVPLASVVRDFIQGRSGRSVEASAKSDD